MNLFGPLGFRALLAVLVALSAALLFNIRIVWLRPSQQITPGTTFAESQPSSADVTAVLLNWVRLANVVQIVTVLCEPSLDGVIKEVVVWNNNPRPLVHDVRHSSYILYQALHTM